MILRGKVRSTTYNDDGSVIDSVVLCQEDGIYGVDIPKNVWHKLEAIESSVIFECKQGPYVPHDLFVRASASTVGAGNTAADLNIFYTEMRDYIAYLISCFELYIDNQEYKI